MEENTAHLQFVKVAKDTVIDFLKAAEKRAVIAKAGYFLEEVEVLMHIAVQKKVKCEVYVDTNEKSVRYGFGERSALELLNKNFELLNVKSSNYIRMAIVIVDDNVMVYSPVALSWEEVPERIDFPNGFIGGKFLVDSLLTQIEGEPKNITVEGLSIPIQICPVIQKSPELIKHEIAQTIIKLDQNPPVDPATLRKTTFYRNKYKLLKMTIHGVNIKNKSISLRPFNTMLLKTEERLKSSWNVLTKEDVESLDSINEFLSQANSIVRKNTYDAGRFGTLIERNKIKQIENCIAFQLYELFDNLMGRGKSDGSHVKKDTIQSLIGLLKDSRADLIDYLFLLAIEEKDCWDQLFKNDKSLYRRLKANEISEREAVRIAIETFVDYRLNFPNAQDMIELMHVEFDYYDISDELLSKEEFFENVEKFDLQIREYKEGYKEQKVDN